MKQGQTNLFHFEFHNGSLNFNIFFSTVHVMGMLACFKELELLACSKELESNSLLAVQTCLLHPIVGLLLVID